MSEINYRSNMKPELSALIAAERKHKRELKELRDLRTTVVALKNPDSKLLGLIDAEIKSYLEPR